eukprot:Gb_05017 [translate_table: standard]
MPPICTGFSSHSVDSPTVNIHLLILLQLRYLYILILRLNRDGRGVQNRLLR